MTRRAAIIRMASFGLACGTALMFPLRALAERVDLAFNSYTDNDVLAGLFGDRRPVISDQVIMKAPAIAENGAVVPIKVRTDLPKVQSISILAKENPQPLAISFLIPEGTKADISTRIRLAKTTLVTAVVEADGQLYSSEQEVKVTIGGCGG